MLKTLAVAFIMDLIDMKGYVQKLDLGQIYFVEVKLRSTFVLVNLCQFIKVTGKGYNFLNIETSRCIFRRHFYFYQKYNGFFIHRNIRIKIATEEEVLQYSRNIVKMKKDV